MQTNTMNKKWVAPKVKPKRANNGKFASTKPSIFRPGSIYRVQQRNEQIIVRYRCRAVDNHVVVETKRGQLICVNTKKMRLATAEEVTSFFPKKKKSLKNA